MDAITLYDGDCLEILRALPDESVDAVVTDPPYNISQNGTALDRSAFKNAKMRRKRKTSLDYGAWDRQAREEFFAFTRAWYAECSRVLRDGGAFISFFAQQDVSLLAWLGEEYDVRCRTIFSMVKTNPMPSVYRRNYLSAVESAFIGSKGEAPWTFNFTTQQEMHNVFTTPNRSVYGATDHPSEKPLGLMEHFVKVHTDDGMTVLDPFMGSGTTGVACANLSRRFIGIEKDDHYFSVAKERINAEMSKPIQTELFS